MTERAGLGFPRACRLRRHSDFQRVHARGVRLADGSLTIWALDNGLAVTRFGVIVGRRHGNAVQRNRRKRVLREAFRLCRAELPTGLDVAAMPRVGAAVELRAWQASLTRLGRRAAERLRRRGGQTTEHTVDSP